MCLLGFLIVYLDRCGVSVQQHYKVFGSQAPGPSTWVQTHDCMREFFPKAFSKFPQQLIMLREAVGQNSKLYMCAKWSGLGTSSLAAAYNFDGIKHATGLEFKIELYSITDIDPLCRSLSRTITDKTHPGYVHHSFHNITDGTDQEVVAELESKVIK